MGMEMSKEEQEKVDEIVHAASNGDFDVVKENLIEMNGKDSSGDTPLHVSALNGHLNIVSVYLSLIACILYPIMFLIFYLFERCNNCQNEK